MADTEERVVSDKAGEKPKAARTEAQVLALKRARERAAVVRAENAELRKKEKEIDRAAAEEARRAKADRVQREYDALNATPRGIAPEEDVNEAGEAMEEALTAEDGEAEYVKKRPTKKKRVIVKEVSSDEEIEVVLPKRKQVASSQDPRYEKAMKKMFEV